jgi:hypothetical protein
VSPEHATTALPRLRWRTIVPLLVVLAVAIYSLLPKLASLPMTAEAIRRLNPGALALALAAQVASYWGNGYTVRSVARLTGDTLSIWYAVRLAIASSTVGLLAGGPVAYAAATYHWMRRDGASHEGAILCGWLPALLNVVILVSLSLAGATELLLLRLLPKSQVIALGAVGIAAAAMVVALVWLVVSKEDRLANLVVRARRVWARVRRRPADEKATRETVDRLTSAAHLLLKRGGWRRPLLGAVANTGFDLVTLWCLFLAARHALGPGALLAGYGLPQLVGRVTFLPGGLGVVEGGMVGLYRAVGVATAIGVPVILAYRAMSFWLPTLIGFPLAATLERSTSRVHPPRRRRQRRSRRRSRRS